MQNTLFPLARIREGKDATVQHTHFTVLVLPGCVATHGVQSLCLVFIFIDQLFGLLLYYEMLQGQHGITGFVTANLENGWGFLGHRN